MQPIDRLHIPENVPQGDELKAELGALAVRAEEDREGLGDGNEQAIGEDSYGGHSRGDELADVRKKLAEIYDSMPHAA